MTVAWRPLLITDAQAKLYRKERMNGKNQPTAAALANMSERTGRRWERGPLPSESQRSRNWRTRKDPFHQHWESIVVPLLELDDERKLQAKTLLAELKRRFPETYRDRHLRTLQRRVSDWRALHSPGKNVVFPQDHAPGRELAFDFTKCDSLGVTLAGQPFPHQHFTATSSHSGWLFVKLAFGETWEALSAGLQEAVHAFGAPFLVWRSDNLSAATQELKHSQGRGLTKRYQELVDHYGVKSTRIRPRKPNENGAAEKGNHRFKNAIDQALRVRGSRDFRDLDAYLAFRDRQVEELNLQHCEATEAEQAFARSTQSLPLSKLPSYSEFTCKVRAWSTISIARRLYSVPSRLIGHELKARLHANHVDVYFKGKKVETFPRLRGGQTAHIDYRHIIWSLVRKPGAFARYRYREELFPSATFRRAYDALRRWRGERADVEYVRILHLAASRMESVVEVALQTLLEENQRFDYADVKALAHPEPVTVPQLSIGTPDLTRFDRLLAGER